ncbi:hypothetical protein K469DRAFT_742362 [Zopfia rhizophila CBS 207.26]|uniref:C2H2-type domain-containing protein n=1 Tax=Zopfia rhizophila CBS 207.26 TaxID=1314779 RepID=A0A6A6DEF7_9PEZI|nr:hypothetical protein K469DRAFT_742362 [Zopfia rhizophila CBS 207.26]
MQRRPSVDYSTEESEYVGSDADDSAVSDTDLIDMDASCDEDNEKSGCVDDQAWLFTDKHHLPEHYLQRLETFDETEYTKEDYKASSTRLLNRIEDQWNHSLRTYWKVYRLVYKRATGVKIDRKMNRNMHKVLRKLAKKHGLKKIGRDKACMYVEDLTVVLQTNLVTTEKRYSYGRYRIEAQLYLQLGGFTVNWLKALLGLCYRHIQVTLLRDPEGGPHQVLLEFTFEFIKKFLKIKDMNTFPISEIMYNGSLIFSPHIFLVGMLFYDRAFAAYNLTSLEELSRLYIYLRRNKLPLRLNRELDNIPVFRQALRDVDGWAISPNKPLLYSTLLPWIKMLGYAGGKAFNENGRVSEAMQNLMMGHADIRTFLKHYLSRRVTVDTQAVVRGIQPQDALMQAACTMSRTIDPRRPWRLTTEESASVNDYPTIRSLLNQREQLKRRLGKGATKHPKYKRLNYEINRERQRQRHALLEDVKEHWEYEQPVRDVERQLANIETKEDAKLVPELHNAMLPAQKELIDAVFAEPGVTLEEEIGRCNRAIRAVMEYCRIKEDAQVDPAEVALKAAKVSVYKEKRLRICFICLGNKKLPVEQRVYSFSSPSDLSKHFTCKHLAYIKEGQRIRCDLCKVSLDNKIHLQRHGYDVHGTVSQSPVRNMDLTLRINHGR